MAAMEALVEKKDKFDYILVETTGLANREPLKSGCPLDAGLVARE